MSPSSSTNVVSHMNLKNTWLQRWIYSLAAGFVFATVLLRSVLVFQGSPLLVGPGLRKDPSQAGLFFAAGMEQ